MQTDSTIRQVTSYERDHMGLERGMHTLLSRISALRVLVREERQTDEPSFQPDIDLPALRQGLSELEQLAHGLLNELHLSAEFILAELPDLPLAEAFSQLVETTAETFKLSSRIAFTGHERPLSDYLARLLYRIAQESLARISMHDGTRRLRFSLDYGDREIVLSVEDDGIPAREDEASKEGDAAFPSFLTTDKTTGSPVPAGHIMQHLRVLAEAAGGTLTVNSGVEQGTQTLARVPYQLSARIAVSPAAANQGGAKITLLVVDAQAVSRAGLRRLLESYPDLEVVGEASDSVQAVSETAELLPQVILVDAQLPESQSIDLLRQIRELNSGIRVLLLSDQEDEELLYEALRAGANGYVLKDIIPDELAQALRAVARGEVLVQPQLAARLLARSGSQEQKRMLGMPQESLTAREQEVLQLLARGLRNKEIAARLIVSERTVTFHLANIYAKLHVSGRTEALSKALEQGLLRAAQQPERDRR